MAIPAKKYKSIPSFYGIIVVLANICGIIIGMATMVESRDNSTGDHIKRTSDCVRVFAEYLKTVPAYENVSEKFFENVIKAAPMHDLGKIAAEQIPFEARIMALADVFDALVSKRCYKDSFSYDKAFEIIQNDLGTHFDPALGAEFIKCRENLEKLYDGYLG